VLRRKLAEKDVERNVKKPLSLSFAEKKHDVVTHAGEVVKNSMLFHDSSLTEACDDFPFNLIIEYFIRDPSLNYHHAFKLWSLPSVFLDACENLRLA
jgi:hypothetical protein